MSEYLITGISPKVRDTSLHSAVQSFLSGLGVFSFGFVRLADRISARVHIPDGDPGAPIRLRHRINYLAAEQRNDSKNPQIVLYSGRIPLYVRIKQLSTTAEDADDIVTRFLAYETQTGSQLEKLNLECTRFLTTGLRLGYLSYSHDEGRFQLYSYYNTEADGSILLGRSAFRFWLDSRDGTAVYQLEIPYIAIQVAIVDHSDGSIAFNLHHAPKISKINNPRVKAHSISTMDTDYSGLSFSRYQLKAERLTKLDDAKAHVVGRCLTYYIMFSDNHALMATAGKLESLGVPFVHENYVDIFFPQKTLEQELFELRDCIDRTFPMSLKFQIHKIATNGLWRPAVIRELIPTLRQLRFMYGSHMLEDAILYLYTESPPLSSKERDDFSFTATELAGYLKSYLRENTKARYLPQPHPHLIPTYRARVTPTSVYLEGPVSEQSNRVLRLYSENITSFLRVTISDENSEPLHYSLTPSILERFRHVLENGIEVYGEPRYEFLGFSNSSLRAQSCWFCSPFQHQGRQLRPETLYKELGDFGPIRCPALCASRIGQAFSDTAHAIEVEPEETITIRDVKRGQYCFSDGCGLISMSLMEEVWDKLYKHKKIQPTTLQIRFGGAKGVVTLDPSIRGSQLVLRESMCKYQSTHRDLEVCASNYKIIPAFLNHQVIKILEDLGIPTSVFEALQTMALKRLMKSFIDQETPRKGLVGVSSPLLQNIFRICSEKGWKCYEDPVLRKAIQLLCLLDLRNIKYRGRILVDKGATLFGIMDEYGVLEEGEIYVTFQNEAGKRSCVVSPRVMITRAPTMAPGDIQVVRAVNVPAGCPLRQLTNCVVFSQKGVRDLASKLGGGDLDGDLYSVIWDARLVPPQTALPASYEALPYLKLARPVVRKDIIEFYLSFMTSDKLGEIATKHKILADQLSEGVLHPWCTNLAKLASHAVDAAKFGTQVDMVSITSKMREMCKFRPHFMRPAPIFELDQEKSLAQSLSDGPGRHIIRQAPDFDEPPHRFYHSRKTLGVLYDQIDEHAFIRELEYKMQEGVQGNLRRQIWTWARSQATWDTGYIASIPQARELRTSYEGEMVQLCHQYSTTGTMPISELEVVSGTILGMTCTGVNRRLRDISEMLRKNLAAIVNRYENWILYTNQEEAEQHHADFELQQDEGYVGYDGDVDYAAADGGANFFSRLKTGRTGSQLRASCDFAMACLHVAINDTGRTYPKLGKIQSFWIFAAYATVSAIDYYKSQLTRAASASSRPARVNNTVAANKSQGRPAGGENANFNRLVALPLGFDSGSRTSRRYGSDDENEEFVRNFGRMGF